MATFRRGSPRPVPPEASAARTADVRANGTQGGFSLVEVTLALGLLGSVLISIAGLSVLGARQLASGRASTLALGTAASILERMEGSSLKQTYEGFGLDGSEASQRVDSRLDPLAVGWRSELDAALRGADLEIELASVEPGGPAPPLIRARAVRVVVRVRWREGARCRALELATVRL